MSDGCHVCGVCGDVILLYSECVLTALEKNGHLCTCNVISGDTECPLHVCQLSRSSESTRHFFRRRYVALFDSTWQSPGYILRSEARASDLFPNCPGCRTPTLWYETDPNNLKFVQLQAVRGCILTHASLCKITYSIRYYIFRKRRFARLYKIITWCSGNWLFAPVRDRHNKWTWFKPFCKTRRGE